jgi:hypothetical protein
VTRLSAWKPGFISRHGHWREFSSSPPRPDRLWGPPSLLSNGYQVFFPWGLSGREREADNSPPSSAEFKKAWNSPISLHGVVLHQAQGKFILPTLSCPGANLPLTFPNHSYSIYIYYVIRKVCRMYSLLFLLCVGLFNDTLSSVYVIVPYRRMRWLEAEGSGFPYLKHCSSIFRQSLRENTKASG